MGHSLSPAAWGSRNDRWLSRESGEKAHRLCLPSRIFGTSDSLSEETVPGEGLSGPSFTLSLCQAQSQLA